MKNETQSDILQSQTNVEENQNKDNFSKEVEQFALNNEKQLRIYHKIKNTPFTIVEEDKRFYMIMGNYKISEKDFETYLACYIEELETNMWHTMGKYFFALLEISQKMPKEI